MRLSVKRSGLCFISGHRHHQSFKTKAIRGDSLFVPLATDGHVVANSQTGDFETKKNGGSENAENE